MIYNCPAWFRDTYNRIALDSEYDGFLLHRRKRAKIVETYTYVNAWVYAI